MNKMADKTYKLKDIEKGKKLQFIWDYYKLPIIAAVLVIATGISLFFFTTNKKTDDICILFTANTARTDAEAFSELKNGIEKFGVDINGDGKSTVSVSDIIFYGDLLNSEYSQQNGTLMTRLLAELTAGDSVIEICDEQLFAILQKNDVTASFKDIGINRDGIVKIPYKETKLQEIVPEEKFNTELFVTVRPGDMDNNAYKQQIVLFRKIIK